MLSRKFVSFAAALLFTGGALPAAAPIPLEAFFRDAEFSRPDLSADGSKIVFLVRNAPARKSIATYNVKTKKGGIVFVPNDYNVDFAFWKGDRIIFGGDVGGNESYALRSIKEDGTSLRDLNESVDRYRPTNAPVGGTIFSRLPDDPKHILVAGIGTRRNQHGEMKWAGEFGLYRLDVGSGRRISVERWDDHATGYLVDARSGKIYGRTLESGRDEVIEIKTPEGEYRRVGQFPAADVPWSFVGLLPGEKSAILEVRSAQEHDRGALYAFDLNTLRRGNLLYEPSEGEITDLARGPDGRIVGVGREAEKQVFEWFDPTWAKLYASLKATLPGKQIVILDSTDDVRFHVVHAASDRDPGTYYLFDAATPTLTVLGRVNSLIDPEQMAPREPIMFKARDGLELHGYLTRPRDAAGRKTPLIIVPHGGPFGIRDSWDFDPEAQFFANRGYAVLQVNYRGSGGYGAKFQEAGKRQWGRAMQDDLTDAVKWAVETGVTAADQVGIYGGSYGGYAVLAGLTFTPELYRCGANYVGVSDLRLLREPTGERTSVGHDVWIDEWLGNSAEDLAERSPIRHIANIRVPSLHAYGENDPRVDIGHWKLLERELKKHGKPYTYIRERDEGHGFEDEKSRIKFYAALEAFFAEHLPVAGQN